MILYHGSEHIVTNPIYGYGSKHNDYGLGFYCTESLELAREWAAVTSSGGYANTYFFDTDGISVLNLTGGDYTILHWLAVLLENRTFTVDSDIARESKDYILHNFRLPYQEYDIIEGYRADDSYFSFAKAFLNNTISLHKLESAMVYGKLGVQVVLKSEKAFSHIEYIDSALADGSIYHPKRILRDQQAREEYARTKSVMTAEDSTYMIDILRGRWSQDDERLQRIVLE